MYLRWIADRRCAAAGAALGDSVHDGGSWLGGAAVGGPGCAAERVALGDIRTVRFFNTAGPIVAARHYHVPPLERIDLDHVLRLIEQWKYFVLHAPRQTGKTSTLLALRDAINADGGLRCVYVNVEVGQSAREDVAGAMRAILGAVTLAANDAGLGEAALAALESFGPHMALQGTFARWAEEEPKPLVLMIDEVDALVGDTLLAVLRQLRAGYPERPRRFPQSVVLCGVRDVRDYRIRSGAEQAIVAGGSAFNVRAESLRLGDFSQGEVDLLLAQHTEETGQAFTAEAGRQLWQLTEGQPWLVNALAYEACFSDEAGLDRSRAITAGAVLDAREQLIQRRETHLDQLADKLQEARVRRVVEPLLTGDGTPEGIPPDDLEYARDLGLVAPNDPVRIANPIYREVIPRDLTWTTQAFIAHEPVWYIGDDGSLLVDKMLAGFQEFFREHSEHWVERFQYKEAGPQLLLQAFLQRIVNRGGRIEREYGLGRMRTDLLIVWPAAGPGGAAPTREPGRTQKAVIECKVLRKGRAETRREGLRQTRAYMDRCGAAEGHLVIFDRDPTRSWQDKLYRDQDTEGGAPVTVWGM